MSARGQGHSNAIYVIRRITRVLALVILLLAGASFLLPTDYRVERSVTIDASPEFILSQALQGDNLSRWMYVKDGALAVSSDQLEAGDSVDILYQGKTELGRFTLLSIQQNLISFDVRPKPKVNVVHNLIRLKSTESGTQLNWVIEGNLSAGLVGPYLAMFANDIAGQNFETSLNQLKELVETAY
ncbi:SRPBCC family protein [Marinomonas posidonica]|uniref:Polyketide cyclase/dehydrase n=1 Tax=Marinomonas posidonica (strain CECT 7376 / NCIMB 14433 / IVIA-Po-181) TaxID=491952 RepID=F6CSF0_MARPP|nr:SRPBCC family protein [Marinomonas posidonica]AEF55004.1 Polyketide cyclase/dehydrase [Marinomonas posidonica IVIA-Po-181]